MENEETLSFDTQKTQCSPMSGNNRARLIKFVIYVYCTCISLSVLKNLDE